MKILRLLPLILWLSACATDDLSLYETAEKDYHKAERLIADGFYGRAALYLGKFGSKYPYSKYATPAELLRIKAAYNNGEFILSETLSKRFMEAHPNHPQLDYVQYILGMSYYHQSESANHEQVFSKKARDTFAALLARSPNNAYADEVKEKLNIMINRMAKHEMIIGKFYFDREFYVGASKRFLVVKNEYGQSNVAAESLFWLASAYIKLKQNDYAKEIVDQLNQQFPNNTWQKKANNLL
jgi:outer membrane protein assembly factor BamD